MYALVGEGEDFKFNASLYKQPVKPPQDGSDTRAPVTSSDDPCSCILHPLELLNLRQWEPNEDCIGEVEARQNGGDDKRLGRGERPVSPDFADEVQVVVGGFADIVDVLLY